MERRKYSLQVERSLFDQILLRRAEQAGATVRQGHRVSTVLWDGDRAVGVVYEDPDGRRHDVRAPWVIDASGRHGLIARDLGLREIDPFYPDLSVYGYFKNAGRFPGNRNGDLLIEAVPYGWFWYIPLHTGEISVGVVSDKTSRPRLQEVGAAQFFREAVEQAPNVQAFLADSELSGPLRVTATSGYRSERYAGPGWLLAGDAGSFTDPMWSTGVAHALQNGIFSGAMIEASQSGRAREDLIISEYNKVLHLYVNHLHRVIKYVYGCNYLYTDQPFWQKRGAATEERDVQIELLRRLSREPAALYFRRVLAGFRVEEDLLTSMDEASVPDALTAALVQQPDAWVLELAEGATMEPGLDLEGGRIVPGYELTNGKASLFLGHPALITTFQSLDGGNTVRDALNRGLENVPAPAQFFARTKLTFALASAAMRGLVRVPAAGSSVLPGMAPARV
jgi:flavin-dependent dehydrogenase